VDHTLDIGSFFSLSLLSLGAAIAGFFSFLAGLRSFLLLAERRRWLSAWAELLSRLPSSLRGALRGDLVCLEGVCTKMPELPLLVSPIFRTSCVAYWIEIRGGVLSRITHLRNQALPFRLRQTNGEAEVFVDPRGAEAIEFPGRTDHLVAEPSTLDAELARHLEATAVRLGSAEPLGITQGKLVPGQTCTIIAPVERTGHAPAPYRELEGAVVGGHGTILVATTSRRQLARELRYQQWMLAFRALASLVAVVGSLSIMTGAALLQPLMFIPLVIVGVPLTGWFLDRQREPTSPALLWPAPPPK